MLLHRYNSILNNIHLVKMCLYGTQDRRIIKPSTTEIKRRKKNQVKFKRLRKKNVEHDTVTIFYRKKIHSKHRTH